MTVAKYLFLINLNCEILFGIEMFGRAFCGSECVNMKVHLDYFKF